MTKLDGTAGQFFSVIADAIKLRGTARWGKNAGAHASGSAGFHDLLHAVSKSSQHGQGDQDRDGSIKSGPLRSRVTLLSELDKTDDDTIRKPSEVADASNAPGNFAKPDQAATADVRDRSALAPSVAQPFADILLVRPQAHAAGNDEEATPARKERSSFARESPAANIAGAIREAGDSHSSAGATHATEASSGHTATPRQEAAAGHFETVTTTIERAARAGGRDALPESTKVTEVQQETHLPPVQPSAPGTQVAKSVVAELESSSPPPSSAASDLAAPQGNAPDQPLKILTISLEPPALGNVTIRLRLVGAAVSVHLTADRKDTSQMLDQQRDSIRDLMRSAGYAADVAPVQHGALDGFQSGSSPSQHPFSGQPQPQGASGGSSTSSGQSQDGARQPRKDQPTHQETRHDQELAPRDRRGAVYL